MNSPHPLQQVEALFHAALERAPDERAAFLAQACADDPGLLDEVSALVAAHEQADGFTAGNVVADYVQHIAASSPDQSPGEAQPTAILPNPAGNSAQRTINQYRIVSLLGKGGMGEVWLAEDTRLRRNVALKLLPAEFTNDADRLRRFEQEALAISALNYPNIITIHEIGESDVGRFIVMELVAGQTLRAIAAEPVAVDSLLAWGGQLAKALHVAHTVGITHRDLKPENIMVRDDGYVKVLDFGLARLRPATESDSEAAMLAQQTTPGTVMGTVAYMSPEQGRGESISHLSDVFALGIVLYELATGRHPFKAETLVGYLHSIALQTPVPLTSLQPDLPAALNDLILRMLSKEAGQRPTAHEVAQALQAIERGEIARVQSVESDTMILPPTSQPATSATQSIAVLPFANISADAENEYFCDGLAEELLNALAKIDDLKVAARTSAFSFKGKNAEAREIGKTLNVNTVVEGSVRKAGNRIRISVQLVNAADGYHLWSERYDREMQDIFDVQDEITLAVVDALKVKLLGAKKAAVLKRYTDNTEAYQLYLQGRFHLNKLTEEGFRKALECYEQAIALKPDYAPAFAGIAIVYINLSFVGAISPDEAVPQIKTAVAKALALDQTLAESHHSLAVLKVNHEWDWEGAEKGFKQALALNPNNVSAIRALGHLLAIKGRRAEAVAKADQALELDPLSLANHAYVGMILFYAGEYERLLAQGRKLMALEPRFHGGHLLSGVEAMNRKDYDQALPALEAAARLGAPMASYLVGCLHGILGQRERAQMVLDELQQMGAKRYVSQSGIAWIYAGLGELDRAFEWLEQAYEQREGSLVYLKQWAALIPGLSADPRLADLLRRIGLPE